MYTTVLTFSFSLNFLYVTFYVLFMGKPLLEIGSIYFITHAFYDFLIIFVYFVIIISYAASANDIGY